MPRGSEGMGMGSPMVQVPGKVFSKPSVKMVVDWADAPWMPRKMADAPLRDLISEFEGGVEFMGLDRLEIGGMRGGVWRWMATRISMRYLVRRF